MSRVPGPPARERSSNTCLLGAALALFAVVVAFCAGLLGWARGVDRTPLTWESVSAVQALTTPDALWVFVQVDRGTQRRGRLASPPFASRIVRQAVAAITSSGDARVTPVLPIGPSFNANLGGIVGVDGRVFVLYGPSSGSDSVPWRWDAGSFSFLVGAERAAFLTEHGLAGMKWPTLKETVAAVNRAHGCELLAAENHPLRFVEARRDGVSLPRDDLSWSGRAWTWDLEHVEGRETVGLRVTLDDGPRWIPLITYDPRRVPVPPGEER